MEFIFYPSHLMACLTHLAAIDFSRFQHPYPTEGIDPFPRFKYLESDSIFLFKIWNSYYISNIDNTTVCYIFFLAQSQERKLRLKADLFFYCNLRCYLSYHMDYLSICFQSRMGLINSKSEFLGCLIAWKS